MDGRPISSSSGIAVGEQVKLGSGGPVRAVAANHRLQALIIAALDVACAPRAARSDHAGRVSSFRCNPVAKHSARGWTVQIEGASKSIQKSCLRGGR